MTKEQVERQLEFYGVPHMYGNRYGTRHLSATVTDNLFVLRDHLKRQQVVTNLLQLTKDDLFRFIKNFL